MRSLVFILVAGKSCLSVGTKWLYLLEESKVLDPGGMVGQPPLSDPGVVLVHGRSLL